jgi:hypothetical protein
VTLMLLLPCKAVTVSEVAFSQNTLLRARTIPDCAPPPRASLLAVRFAYSTLSPSRLLLMCSEACGLTPEPSPTMRTSCQKGSDLAEAEAEAEMQVSHIQAHHRTPSEGVVMLPGKQSHPCDAFVSQMSRKPAASSEGKV